MIPSPRKGASQMSWLSRKMQAPFGLFAGCLVRGTLAIALAEQARGPEKSQGPSGGAQ
jgi:hypothetical protein